MVQGTTAGHSYTLRLYYNQSRGTSETGHAVTAVSVNPFPFPVGPSSGYWLPIVPGKPCLCYRQGAGRGSPGRGPPELGDPGNLP